MSRIAFHVVGVPKPKGNHRAGMVAGRARLYDATRGLGAWETAVRAAAGNAMAGAGHIDLLGPAVSINVKLRLPRERVCRTGKARRFRDPQPTARGSDDLDKLVRAVGDAMAGVVYADDAAIVEIHASKRWALDGEPTGAVVTVEEVWRCGPMTTG